ncbi:MAG: hypothetical protein FJX65_18525 [Alphaproteobacteria bacterium]|nr:hypothetical protein [Alphaproteobacteria bacterium]
MATYTIDQAKKQLSKLIARACAREDVVIARGRTPLVRLTPVLAPSKPRFGALKGKIEVPEAFFEPLPHDDLKRWG